MKTGEDSMINDIVTGYKATDKNMQCRGYQFELGKWHVHDGEIAMCESGFHFCEFPSGPWAFYQDEDTRIFKVEARGVLKGEGPGADLKHVAMEIRLVEDISITGNRNTGNWNTGDRNTGSRNTGNWNTGDRNTGNWNTGDWNTGEGNATDRCSGFLCSQKKPLIIFDEPVSCDESQIDFYLISLLSEKLLVDDSFDTSPFLSIPNATHQKIIDLHKTHIERRNIKKTP